MSDAQRKRRLRFSLAMLMALVTLLGISLGAWQPLHAVRERLATRQWIESKRGQVIYIKGVRELYPDRGRVEAADGDFVMSPWRALLGDEKAILIAIFDDGTFREDEVARIKAIFPEAGIWFDQ